MEPVVLVSRWGKGILGYYKLRVPEFLGTITSNLIQMGSIVERNEDEHVYMQIKKH